MPPPSDPDIRRQLKARLLALPPRAFELFAGDLLEFMGLRNVTVTRYSGDGGIDAIGSLETSIAPISIPTGVQVKRYSANVQRADIDRFIGALSGQYAQGIFITTAGYARQAALKAVAAIPRVATVDGDQVAALMLRHHLGVVGLADAASRLDEEYFSQFEAQAAAWPRRIAEQPEAYQIGAEVEVGRAARPEEDLISLRALSHALRVDTSALRRWIEKGRLRPSQPGPTTRAGYFFRRDQIEAIRAELLGRARPANSDQWRQEFLDFARTRNLSKSYKPVMLRALLKVVNRNGEANIGDLVREFRAFYVARQREGLRVEFGPPDITDASAVSDIQLRQLIVKHPLERFLIKGFLEYIPEEGVVRFAPQLWADLRFWELLDIQQSADEQLAYYYSRPR
jgi:hypothetical protein